MRFSLADSARSVSHLLLPVSCALCERPLMGDPVPFFCRSCWSQLKPLSGPECPRCGRPFGSAAAMRHSPDWTCEECRRRPPAFSKAWSCFRYDSPLKDALHLFKYSRKVALAGPLASLFQTRPIDPQAFDLVMPVPLHPDRLRDREFNQALLLADRLARRSSIPLSYDNLMRTKAAPPQSELSRAARLTNLRRAFAVREPAAIRDARILLIDDVFTTGATAHACAKALRRAGAGPVSVCTLARAV